MKKDDVPAAPSGMMRSVPRPRKHPRGRLSQALFLGRKQLRPSEAGRMLLSGRARIAALPAGLDGRPVRRAFGTTELARICQVTPPTVGRWIDDGKLPSFSTAGGHRRVWAVDVAAFLKNHNIPLPPEMQLEGAAKVLIVDDEADVRHLVVRALRRMNPSFEIHEASDGFEAGQKMTRLVPEIVILDIRLPGIDGLKVCRLIRAQRALHRVRILAVSGYDIDAARQECLEAGADDFLGKPFDWHILEKKIMALISADRYAKIY